VIIKCSTSLKSGHRVDVGLGEVVYIHTNITSQLDGSALLNSSPDRVT